MHYLVEDGHGLPHDPFKAIVAPRPIGWISSLDSQGVANLAPYSFFNGVASAPPMIMFAVTGRKIGREHEVKDSLTNIRATGEFAVNLVGWDLRDAMNTSSGGYGPEEDEFVTSGLEKADCLTIRAPRVAAAPAALECVMHQIVDLPSPKDYENSVVFGRVQAVHIRDEYLTDGIFDLEKVRPVARCGYKDYAVVTELFRMTRPGGGDAVNMAATR